MPTFLNTPTAKILLIGALSLLLMIPTIWISSLVTERRGYRDQAASEAQAMWGGPQTVGAPLLVLPYNHICMRSVETTINTATGPVTKTTQATESCTSYIKLYADKLSMQGDFPSSERKRGIYTIPLYRGDMAFTFNFAKPDWQRLGVDPTGLDWEKAYMALYIKDTRGLKSAPMLQFEGESAKLEYEQVDGKPWDNMLVGHIKGVEALVTNQLVATLQVHLNGSESFYFLPYAREAKIAMSSDWNSPSFSGMFLPESRKVDAKGFKANWAVMSLNHTEPMVWMGENRQNLNTEMSVGFKQLLPVDHYSMTERAIKYVILFIALTFILCFFAERLTGANINPLQYLLIGLSLLLFYTLLLSLSETVGFGIAYGISTLAITAQIGFFVRMILKQGKATWIAITLLNALYAFLFVLLRLEDMSLLAGSLGLFVILGALMYISVKTSKSTLPCPES